MMPTWVWDVLTTLWVLATWPLTIIWDALCGLGLVLPQRARLLGNDNDPDASPVPSSPSFTLIDQIVHARDINDLVKAHGYRLHEHVVQTPDGYLLTIHRLLSSTAGSPEPEGPPKPVVYFHHGLLTNSELFVLGETAGKCLPFVLLEQGHDVWLGNNRGNKYSRKHVSRTANSPDFWNFSLDEYALYDIPSAIDYVLQATGRLLLAYIGFSQGSAQALAALSLSPALNQKIHLFVGLSPAMVPRNLNHPVLKAVVNLAPLFLYRVFGQRAILPSVIFWQNLFGPLLYEWVVDRSLTVLFGWKSLNITPLQKLMGYTHMFSPSSVKSVVHWFQIIKSRRFQMYDEGGNAGLLLTSLTLEATSSKNHRVAPFPVQNITTPIMLVYGKADILVDIESSRANLTPRAFSVVGIDGYEHMDLLWGAEVETLVFEPIAATLARYATPERLTGVLTGLSSITLAEGQGSGKSTPSQAHRLPSGDLFV